jgi:hypothetical protein
VFGLSSIIFVLIAMVLVLPWLFQGYWGVQTFFDAKDDIQKGSKVSEWLYARFVTPIAIALVLVFAAFESVLQGGDLNWGIYCLIASLLLLWPSILVLIIIRTYELVKTHASKAA